VAKSDKHSVHSQRSATSFSDVVFDRTADGAESVDMGEDVDERQSKYRVFREAIGERPARVGLRLCFVLVVLLSLACGALVFGLATGLVKQITVSDLLFDFCSLSTNPHEALRHLRFTRIVNEYNMIPAQDQPTVAFHILRTFQRDVDAMESFISYYQEQLRAYPVWVDVSHTMRYPMTFYNFSRTDPLLYFEADISVLDGLRIYAQSARKILDQMYRNVGLNSSRFARPGDMQQGSLAALFSNIDGVDISKGN
jgi:hypothetical protein